MVGFSVKNSGEPNLFKKKRKKRFVMTKDVNGLIYKLKVFLVFLVYQ